MTTGVWPGEKASDPQRAPLTTIDLVDAWPEIAGAIGSPDLALARRALVTLVTTARDEDVFERLGTRAHGALTFLVVDGVVLKVTRFADRSGWSCSARAMCSRRRSRRLVRWSRRP